MNNSQSSLTMMDRLSASLSTPLDKRAAMERDFDKKFMAGIKTRSSTESNSSFSSLASTGSSLPKSSFSSSHYSSTSLSSSNRKY